MDHPEADDRVRDAKGARRVAGWAAGGFLLLQLGWLLVMPPATGIDEFDHIYRASAVAMGHWRPALSHGPSSVARGGYLPVRADLVAASGPACARLRYTKKYNCQPFRQLGGGNVLVACGADTYNPTFYALIGTLARPFNGNAAILVMRVATSLICAGIFALAAYLTARWARTRWPLVGLLLGCLPTTVYSTTVAAPNGPQMMSGLLVWAALAALVRGRPETRTIAYAGMLGGVAVLANTHTLGLLWIGLIALTAVVYLGTGRAIAQLLPRSRAELIVLVVAIAAFLFELWWLWYAHPNDPAAPEGGLSGNPWPNILENVPLWPLQAIGAFPFRNEPASSQFYAIAIVVLGAFATISVRALRGQRALIRTTGALATFSVSVPIFLTALTYHEVGTIWQGRYGMPLSVGLFFIAALALDGRRTPLRHSFLVVGAAAWGLTHLLGQGGVLHKQEADHVLVAATGWWAPPLALVVLIAIAATVSWIRALASSVDASATTPSH
jgi:hypothetical protein